jgi:hypothetical protein
MIFRVDLGNIGPIDGKTDTRSRREFWVEMANHFAHQRALVRPDTASDLEWEVSVDASDAIAFLEAIEMLEESPEVFDERVSSQRCLGRHFLSSALILHLTGPEGDYRLGPASAAGKFLQQLFLGMNVALPGSMHLAGRFVGELEITPAPPSLTSDLLESAFQHAVQRAWPPLSRLSFGQTWQWLEEELPYTLEVAEHPHHRALLSLLYLSTPGYREADMLLLIAQVLEAFFSDGKQGVGSVLRKRLELVLGAPATHSNWFNKFYERRSRIAHGSAPVFRPRDYTHDENEAVAKYFQCYLAPIDEAFAVLLAILQDLVTHDARQYSFPQEVLRQPRK